MATKAGRAPRRSDALSRQRIVEAAAEILDTGGENALTFRALTTRLATGYGAVYHHVASKGELLAAATDDVIARVTAGIVIDTEPRAALRAVALGLFDAIDAHPWIGAQLSLEPSRPALLGIYERVGALLDALNVPEDVLFDAAGALMNYVFGVAGQNAANARVLSGSTQDRAAFLGTVAGQWAQLDPGRYPFVSKAATHLREHDDREQFLLGVDLFLAGIETISRR